MPRKNVAIVASPAVCREIQRGDRYEERRTKNEERRTKNEERRTKNEERRTKNEERRKKNEERRKHWCQLKTKILDKSRFYPSLDPPRIPTPPQGGKGDFEQVLFPPFLSRGVSFSDKSSFCRGSAKNAYPPQLAIPNPYFWKIF
ncbi:MAG: hypothetical protein EA000_18470 [Oscillatoriales cyanobacterium]|nr:MAG: hypothetical protein EA000_18470 [Oscillatoriales cyanobacterium]